MDIDEISEAYASDFRQILGLAPEAALPAGLLELFARYKHRIDVASAGQITAKELILVVTIFEAMTSRPTAPERKSAKD